MHNFLLSLQVCLWLLAAPYAMAQSYGHQGKQASSQVWKTGENTPRGYEADLPSTAINITFPEQQNNRDRTGMVMFSATTGRYGLSLGYHNVNALSGATTRATDPAGTDTASSAVIGTALGEYRLGTDADTTLWLGGGVRYWDVSTDLNLTAGIEPTTTVSAGDSWFDPLLGMRGRSDLGHHWFATGWAYAGGFGTGSEAMIDVLGGVGYEFTGTVSGVLGYRYMSVERNASGSAHDLQQQGFMAGVSFNF
ncbi:hypothetical protein ROLI_016120 [Roseobacter fucihabitans]|uniref:Outer membrane protein beta-barrel domain-containing protein n=1 Tax=Roseobacter fucihabitans TaxID=1537242 RepID=A0ABZ2BRQ9_9RHOB|nr:hypothetical protein [Roseobacter litoralis]MBC6966645.1 hypothetical protein [Roseobacter litoralis]